MKTIIYIALSILSVSIIENAKACQIAVNRVHQKNLLVAYAAAEMNVDLGRATSISHSEYQQTTSGADSGSSCPRYLDNQLRVSVTYKPNLFTTCSFSAIVHKREVIWWDGPLTEPMISVTLEAPISECHRVPVVLKPVPALPLPH